MATDHQERDVHLPPGLLELAEPVWMAACQHTHISAFHKSVAQVLADMGQNHVLEQLTEDRLLSVDIALEGTCPAPTRYTALTQTASC